MSLAPSELPSPVTRGTVPQRPRRPRKGGAWGKSGFAAIISDPVTSQSDVHMGNSSSTTQQTEAHQCGAGTTDNMLICDEADMDSGENTQDLTTLQTQQKPPNLSPSPPVPSHYPSTAGGDQHPVQPSPVPPNFFPANQSVFHLLPSAAGLTGSGVAQPSSPSSPPSTPLFIAPHPNMQLPKDPSQLLLPQNLNFWSPTNLEGMKALNGTSSDGTVPPIVPLPPAALLGQGGTAQVPPCVMLDGRVLVPPGSPAAAAAAMAGRAAFSLMLPYSQNKRAIGKGKGPGTGRRACGCPARMCKCGACPPKPANARRQKGKGPGTGRRACGCPSRRCSCGAAALASFPQVPMLVPVLVDAAQGSQHAGMIPQSGLVMPMHQHFLRQLQQGHTGVNPFSFPVPCAAGNPPASSLASPPLPSASGSHDGEEQGDGGHEGPEEDAEEKTLAKQPCTDLRLGDPLSPSHLQTSLTQIHERARGWLSPSSMKCGSPATFSSSQDSGDESDREDQAEEGEDEGQEDKGECQLGTSDAEIPRVHAPRPSKPRCHQDLTRIWALSGGEEETCPRRKKEGEGSKGKRLFFGGSDSQYADVESPMLRSRGHVGNCSSDEREGAPRSQTVEDRCSSHVAWLQGEVLRDIRCFARAQHALKMENLSAGHGGGDTDGDISPSAGSALGTVRHHGKRAKCMLLKLHRLCSLPAGCGVKGAAAQTFNNCEFENGEGGCLVSCAGACGRRFHPACLSWRKSMGLSSSSDSSCTVTDTNGTNSPGSDIIVSLRGEKDVHPDGQCSSAKLRGFSEGKLLCAGCRAWGEIFRTIIDYMPSANAKGIGLRSSSSCSNMALLAGSGGLRKSPSLSEPASLGWSWENIVPRDVATLWKEWAKKGSIHGKGVPPCAGGVDDSHVAGSEVEGEGEGRSAGCSCTHRSVCGACVEAYSSTFSSLQDSVTHLLDALETLQQAGVPAKSPSSAVESTACQLSSIPPTPPLQSRLASCSTSLDTSVAAEGERNRGASTLSTPQNVGKSTQAFSPWIRKGGLVHSLFSPGDRSAPETDGPATPDVKAWNRGSPSLHPMLLQSSEQKSQDLPCFSPATCAPATQSQNPVYPCGKTVVYLTLGGPDSLAKSAAAMSREGNAQPIAVMPVQLADGNASPPSRDGICQSGRVEEDGKHTGNVGYLCYYYVQGDQASAQFVTVETSPPDLEPSPPPSRKRRRKQPQPRCSAALELVC